MPERPVAMAAALIGLACCRRTAVVAVEAGRGRLARPFGDPQRHSAGRRRRGLAWSIDRSGPGAAAGRDEASIAEVL